MSVCPALKAIIWPQKTCLCDSVFLICAFIMKIKVKQRAEQETNINKTHNKKTKCVYYNELKIIDFILIVNYTEMLNFYNCSFYPQKLNNPFNRNVPFNSISVTGLHS